MDNAGGDQNIDNTVVAQAVAATIDEVYARTGKDSILVTHSQGGMPGWETARYTDHIAAIVAIEPGMAPQVDSDDYKALLEKKIPVTFYYGDYIGEEFTCLLYTSGQSCPECGQGSWSRESRYCPPECASAE